MGNNPARRRPRGGWLVVAFTTILTFLVALLLVLTLVPVVSPSAGADMADMLRAVIGPVPVAVLESFSFQMQDIYNQVRYRVSGDQPQIVFSNPSPAAAQAAAIPSTPTPDASGKPAVPPGTPLVDPPAVQATPLPVWNVITDPPAIGWRGYGPDVNGSPAMARALVMLDPQRSYASMALVRIDLARLHLHMMPGNIEPAHPSGIGKVIPFLGMVPPDQQLGLVAAFNGGFKQVHGYYGMMAYGLTLLPPKTGIATVAIYSNGQVKIGSWGADIVQTPDMLAFRQNCPPIISGGAVNKALYSNNRSAWGTTSNKDITWRTGLGITQDGRYLIYAVGNGISASTLAESMQAAGAFTAMQLDVHQYYAHFDTYAPNNDPTTQGTYLLTGTQLLDEMNGTSHIYLMPNPRDFFYLTTY